MKPAILFFCLVIVTSPLFANPGDYLYSIQVGANREPDMTRFEKLIPLGHLYRVQTALGIQRIRLGTFSDRNEAESVLSKVENAGFFDAFLVKTPLHDGVSIYSVQVITYNHGDSTGWRNVADQLEQSFVDARGAKIKVFSGEFADKKAAAAHAKMLKDAGFGDAFVKQVNRKSLIAVSRESDRKGYQKSPIVRSASDDDTAKTKSISDPTSLPIWNSLTPEQQKGVVFLDGALHIKQGNRFIPLEDLPR